jgi:hypothetical protein
MVDCYAELKNKKARHYASPFVFLYELSPVTFLQDVSAIAVDPAMSNPVGSRARWMIIMSSDPHIARAIPTVIARNPFISRAWTGTWVFNHRNGRCDAHYDLRDGGSGQQAQSEQSC